MTHKPAREALVRSGLPSMAPVANVHQIASTGVCGCGSRWSLEHMAAVMREALLSKEVWT